MSAEGAGGGLRLSADPNAVCHLVCCRAPDWSAGFCGERSDHINYVGPTCEKCKAALLALDPLMYQRNPPRCPLSGEPCPTEHEVNVRVAQETDPS